MSNAGNIKINFKIKVLLPIIAIFTVSILVISYTHYRMLEAAVKANTDENLSMFSENILTQINHLEIILDATKQTLSQKHIAIAKSIAFMLDNTAGYLTPRNLQQLAEPLDIIELSIADRNGIITNSSVPKYIGFDYKSSEITEKYMALANGTLNELSEEPRASVFYDDLPGEINHYVGLARARGFIQIGFNAGVIGRLQNEINIERTIKETRIGANGYGIVLSSGIITAHPDESLLGKDVSGEQWYKMTSAGDGVKWIEIDGESYYAGYKNEKGVTVIGLAPEADYYRDLHHLRTVTLTFLVMVIALMTIIVYFILDRLLQPINHLAKGLKEIGAGHLDARIEGSYNDEFDKIKDAVNSMAADIKKYMEDKLQAEKKLNESRISIMLSQIQPHFLYNALAVISRLCDKDPAEAKRATINFSNYLRANMNLLERTEPIPFVNELNHTIGFLNLEKSMYGEALNVIYDIQAENFKLPALTVQPIVENAVKHGIGKKEGGGIIIIQTKETENDYQVIIKDNGAGFDCEKTANEAVNDGEPHIGINNVRLRLSAQCGGSLEIESKLGEGTTAKIIIPKK